MKRFWSLADASESEGAWLVRLDGRPIRTPGRRLLAIPGEALAAAIAKEWNGVAEGVDPRTMPLTGLANAAIDRVAPDPEGFASGLARYGEGDLLCYRAAAPKGLADRQSERWDPLLGWARRRYDVDFAITTEILHVAQPRATVERLGHAVAALDPFRLAGLSPLVTVGGSLVGALAVLEQAVAVDEAWAAVSLDDEWQMEQWGADAEAQAALAGRKQDFLAAAHFLALLGPDGGRTSA